MQLFFDIRVDHGTIVTTQPIIPHQKYKITPKEDRESESPENLLPTLNNTPPPFSPACQHNSSAAKLCCNRLWLLSSRVVSAYF